MKLRQSQRGMAHVNIFWVLVPMVLMLAALAYAYDRHTSLDTAMEKEKKAYSDLQKVKNDNSILKEQLTKLTGVLENVGDFSYEAAGLTNNEFVAPGKLETTFDAFKSSLGLPASQNKLNEILSAAQTKVNSLTGQIATLQNSLKAARAEKSAAEQSLTDTRTTKDADITRLENEKRETEKRIEAATANYEGQLADARQNTQRARESQRKTEKESADKIKKMEGEVQIRDAKLQSLSDKLRLINSPEEPDGRVISSSERTGLAFINLGAYDMLKKGITFRVLEPIKGGYKFKANAVVTKVYKDKAEVAIRGLVDSMNPVVAGDVVTNDLYSPKLKRNIFLLGRFVTPLTKDEIAHQLTAMGCTVHKKWSPSVDLVIIGRESLGEEAVKLEDMPEYQKARTLSIEMVSLQKIRDFLRLRR